MTDMQKTIEQAMYAIKEVAYTRRIAMKFVYATLIDASLSPEEKVQKCKEVLEMHGFSSENRYQE